MKKTPKREFRLCSAKNWVKIFSGNNLVKAYSKKYAVDKICAIKELRILGVDISEAYENQLRQSLESLKQQRQPSKEKREHELNTSLEFESDENFAVILGYTSGGSPYGLTHEDMEELNKEE
jgi:hypothetical protein